MNVKRIGFLGIRTDAVAEMTSFVRDVLGVAGAHTDPTWTISRLPSGQFDFVEVYSKEFDDERVAPNEDGIFVAFIVDDVVSAREEIIAAGCETGEIVWAEQAFGDAAYAGLGWFFVRAPDGRTYVIEQAPD